MTPEEVKNSVYHQMVKLKQNGLKPTAILVGEDTLRSFLMQEVDYSFVQDAAGHYGPPSMMGVRLHRTFDDQPFTVLTDGSRYP